MQTPIFTSQSIPLTHLILHKDNVYQMMKGNDNKVAEIAASIRSIGLINQLTVAKIGKDKFGVIAGGRRLAAP